MKTVSINVMNLCVPCENRCRYCLLSYDGKVGGVDYGRSEAYAKRFYQWIKANRPDLSFLFGFGYSMEHPKLLKKAGIQLCHQVAADGVSELLKEMINGLDEASYQQYLRYQFYLCEKTECLGMSNHLLFVGEKE